jgi:hypothetical protein
VNTFKLTKEILNLYWDNSPPKSITPPITEDWHNQREITIEDVSIWEQIYRQPGNFGIYAAYTPYAEFYIVVYELFLNTPQGIVTYRGTDAPSMVYNKALEMGIDLSTID